MRDYRSPDPVMQTTIIRIEKAKVAHADNERSIIILPILNPPAVDVSTSDVLAWN
jgi:hypothetical protein